jgi:hypothetical protein
MTIAKSPKRSTETRAEKFIAEAGKPVRSNKILTPVRFAPEMLERIDKAARRLGISRSAFINSSAAEKLERMEA